MSVAVLAQIHRQVASPHKSVASDKFDGAFNIMDSVRIRVCGIFTLIRRKACKVEYNIVKRECLHSFKPDIFLNNEKYIVKETTLYSAFTRMEKNGYITSFPGVGENGGKKRTYYQITDEGRLYYQSKCEEWALTKEVIEKFIVKEN